MDKDKKEKVKMLKNKINELERKILRCSSDKEARQMQDKYNQIEIELRNLLCPYKLIEWAENEVINLKEDYSVEKEMFGHKLFIEARIDEYGLNNINKICIWEQNQDFGFCIYFKDNTLRFSPEMGKGNGEYEKICNMFESNLSEIGYKHKRFENRLVKYL